MSRAARELCIGCYKTRVRTVVLKGASENEVLQNSCACLGRGLMLLKGQRESKALLSIRVALVFFSFRGTKYYIASPLLFHQAFSWLYVSFSPKLGLIASGIHPWALVSATLITLYWFNGTWCSG